MSKRITGSLNRPARPKLDHSADKVDTRHFFSFFFNALLTPRFLLPLFFPPLFFPRHCTRVKAPRAVGERGWTSEKGASRTNEVQSAARRVINVAQERGTTFHPAKSVDNPSRDIIIWKRYYFAFSFQLPLLLLLFRFLLTQTSVSPFLIVFVRRANLFIDREWRTNDYV